VAAFREFWWVRHGESVGNAGHRTSEAATYPLTARGFEQAEAFARSLDREPSLFVVSPYTRSQQTAAPSAQRHRGVPVAEWQVHEINYLDPKRCVNTTQFERRALAKDFWEMSDPDFVDGVGAESFAQFIGRTEAALGLMRARTEPFTVIFSHAIFMRGLLWSALMRPPHIDREAMQLFHHFSMSFDVPNCSVLRLLIDEAGTIYAGPITDPSGAAGRSATAEEIRLSGL
jgi:broad specificity phosphatase PhoE